MKVRTLYDLNAGLSDLLDKEIPAPVAYKVSRNHAKVTEELTPVEEQRQKLAERKDTAKADKEFGEILNEDVKLDLSKIKVDDLQGVDIKQRIFALLDEIIKEEDNE